MASPDTPIDVGGVPSPEEPADALAAVVALRRLADQLELSAVRVAVRDGWTWADVADALGVTRQAAHKKHAHRLKNDEGT